MFILFCKWWARGTGAGFSDYVGFPDSLSVHKIFHVNISYIYHQQYIILSIDSIIKYSTEKQTNIFPNDFLQTLQTVVAYAVKISYCPTNLKASCSVILIFCINNRTVNIILWLCISPLSSFLHFLSFSNHHAINCLLLSLRIVLSLLCSTFS